MNASNILHVTLFQSVTHRGVHEVGMAAGVHVFAHHEVVHVEIAPAPDDVVDTSSIVVEAIDYDIIEDRRKRPHVGVLRLEPVLHDQVR